YNATTDFAPVGLLVELPMVMVARMSLPANDLPEFIAYAKANQAKMQYGSAGTGPPTHLSCALLNPATGVNIPHTPNSPPAAGPAGSGCREDRLPLPQRRGRNPAYRGQDREGDHDADQEPLAGLSRSRDRA